MATLKSFWDKARNEKNTSLAVPSSSCLANVVAAKIASSNLEGISNLEASKFGNKLSELVESSVVIDELSDRVGAPMINETEDEFVERAKLTLAKILKMRLSK